MAQFQRLSRTLCCSAFMIVAPPLLAALPVIEEQLIPYEGFSVAVSGEWAVAGNIRVCTVNVYRYDYIANEWGDGAGNAGTAFQTLSQGPNCNSAKDFGASTSIDGGLIAVGAPGAKPNGGNASGAVFLYSFDGTDWVEENVATPTILPALPLTPSGDIGFGQSVSVRFSDANNALIIVGAPGYDVTNNKDNDAGGAFIYNWNGTQAFLADGVISPDPTEGANFGSAVTSNGVQILVGSPNADAGAGEADVFEFNSVSSSAEHKQTISDDTTGITTTTGLGQSVSLTSDLSMLLGGETAYTLAPSVIDNPATFEGDEALATGGGDVSQSLGLAGFGLESSSQVDIFTDPTNLSTIDWEVSVSSGGVDYGRDISLDEFRVLVNGNNDLEGAAANSITYAYYTACGVKSAVLETNIWEQVGLPCLAETGEGSLATFGDIFTGMASGDTRVYRQNSADLSGTQEAYSPVTADEEPEMGVAYWVKSTAGGSWRVNDPYGQTTPVVGDPLLDRDAVAAVFSIDLKALTAGDPEGPEFRLMISNVFPGSIVWSEAVMRLNGGNPQLISDIAYSGYFEGGSPTAYVFDPVTRDYTAISGAGAPGMATDTIAPSEGFYIDLDQTSFEALHDGTDSLELLLPLSK
ncbi:MAG: hypothetical protein ABJN62_19375 [Halioglobus sp.]